MEVYSMSDEFKSSLIEKSKKWVHENYSTENVMKKVLAEFDKMPLIKKRITTKDLDKHNPNCFVPDIEDNQKWLMSLYENILGQIVSPNDDGMLHWMMLNTPRMPCGQRSRCWTAWISSMKKFAKKVCHRLVWGWASTQILWWWAIWAVPRDLITPVWEMV